MKILQVNKYHYVRGGAERYCLDLSQMLEKAGHEVAFFSMDHPKNLPTKWSKYFVSRISFSEPKLRDYLIAPLRILYSFEAKRKFKKLLLDFKPDIIHLHNIYNQISPSILPVAKMMNIPVVMHLHDYSLVSPDHQLFCRGKIYTRALGGHYLRCAFDRCHKNSFSKSLLASFAMILHHKILKIYEKNIDAYIAPSEFMKSICVRAGFAKEKIFAIPNFVSSGFISQAGSTNLKNYILFYGRLSEEKGLDCLIRAMKDLTAPYTLKIVGEGPYAEHCNALIKKLKLESKIEMISAMQGDKLRTMIAEATALMLPSIWYENMSLTLLESIGMGKVVIGSRIGGIPEVLTDNVNGFLCEANNPADWTKAINNLANADLKAIGEAAAKTAESFAPDLHLKKIISVYERYVS